MKITKTTDYKKIKDIFNYEISTDNPFLKTLVIEENNDIYGFITFSIIYDRIEIEMILVQEEYRRKKIGTQLMEYLDDYSLQNNIKNITLEVRETNIPAISLYQKHGYKKEAIRKNYYQNENGILMVKEVKI